MAAEALRPEWHQRGVGGAGYRVFIDPNRWAEYAAGDILFVAGSNAGLNRLSEWAERS